MKEKDRNESVPVCDPKESINHPDHYQGKYECIELIRAIYGDAVARGFCIGNSYKYRFRAGKKDGESREKDISKAEWYEDYMMTNLRHVRSDMVHF